MSKDMRLADFIRSELEPILQDWEDFAATILHVDHMDKTGLRDHAQSMILAIADDLDSDQSESEQAEKSKGKEPDDGEESCAIGRFQRVSNVPLWCKCQPVGGHGRAGHIPA